MMMPSRAYFTGGEVALRVSGEPDALGRVEIVAFWLGSRLPHDGVSSQGFLTNLAGFVSDCTARGRKVVGLDEHTRQLLDATFARTIDQQGD